jgi:hypothetical protein
VVAKAEIETKQRKNVQGQQNNNARQNHPYPTWQVLVGKVRWVRRPRPDTVEEGTACDENEGCHDDHLRDAEHLRHVGDLVVDAGSHAQ